MVFRIPDAMTNSIENNLIACRIVRDQLANVHALLHNIRRAVVTGFGYVIKWIGPR